MKICVTGFSGCGKTTLAKKISEKLGFDLIHSDFALSRYDLKEKKKTELSQQEYEEIIKELISRDNWIFERRHILPQIFKQADVIIWLKTPLLKSLLWQWKRYFTDIEQRLRFTFLNNIELSKNIIFQQHFGKEDPLKSNDPRHTPNEKYVRIFKNYSDKVKILRDRDEINQFFNTL